MTQPETRNFLHRIEYPATCEAADLYFRHSGADPLLDHGAQTIRIPARSSLRFDTYFNCFSVEVWAQHAELDDVVFEIEVDAPCKVELWSLTKSADELQLSSVRVEPPLACVELPRHHTLEGVVGARIHAFDEPVTVSGGGWSTSSSLRREVRLGVGITTFNRPDYIRRTVDQLTAYAAARPENLRDVVVQVVDNASNLELQTDSDDLTVRVLPNRNLGGAGGFARNLMEYRAEGWATHVLFMDDDISLLPSTIDRTKAFLSFATAPQTCVSGAMLSEDDPTIQFEAGAWFRSRGLHPLMAMRGGLELDTSEALARNAHDLGIEYGAWWFFAFPIDLTDDNPLPVFVRGDDAEFSVTHARGHIRAMNGIGVWHQAFEYKNNPMMFHLELRNLPLVSLIADPGYRRQHFIKRFATLSFRSMLAMKYDSAEAMLRGTNDFLDGPDRWLAVDHMAELGRIRSLDGEKLQPFPKTSVPPRFQDFEGWARRFKSLVALALFSGHLVPRPLSRLGRRVVPVQSRSIAAPLGREELLYYWEPTSEGFVARRDRRRFFRLLRELDRTVRRAWKEFPEVAEQYRNRRGEFVSDEYWMRHFELDQLTLAQTPASADSKAVVN